MRFCLITLCCGLLTSTVWSNREQYDWPQWQGPDRNAISKEKGLQQEWPKDGPPLAWRITGLGGGDSAPAVAGGKLFGMSNRDGKEIVWALSEADGKELWATSLGDAVEQRMRQSKEGPGCTPTVDGDRLYVIGMGGRVACLRTQNGELVWQRSMVDDFGGSAPAWSYRESPLIDGDKLICTPGASNAMIVALDKETGKTVWQCAFGNSNNSGEPADDTDEQENRTETVNSEKPIVVVPTGSKWRYLDKGTTPNEAWIRAGFSDDDWSEGQAQLGYGDNDEKTRLDNSAKTYPTYYFRKSFMVDDPTVLKPLVLRLLRDDGAIVYLNGKEVCRDNMPDGSVGRETLAEETTPVEDDFYVHKLANERLVAGANLLAIEVHQSSATSSDVSFDLEIREQVASDRPGVPPRRRFGGRGRLGGSGAAYSSVIAIDFEGERQYVQLTAKALIGVSAMTGDVLWEYSAPANGMGINCSTPIYHDGLVFAASAYGAGGGAVRLVKQSSGEIEAEEIYFTNRMQNHHGGMIVIDGALYGANGGNGGGLLTCLDFRSGETLWRDRDGPKGALAFADGRLYLRDEEGPVVLIEPSREGFVERGRFEQPDRSNVPAWAHPIVANGKLYIRDQDMLLCYDVKARK